MIDQSTIDKVIDTAKIEEVVGEEVDLRRRGVNLLGLCPFHNEKTPSFTVSPAKGIFKCFGCGEGGDSVGFIMKFHRIGFLEAIKKLASKYNIEVEEVEETPEAIQRRKEKEAIQIVLNWSQGYYHQQVEKMKNSEDHPKFVPFLNQWFVSSEAIEKYRIGLSTSSGDELLKEATNKGYKKEALVSTGLILKNRDQHKDFFGKELIFPVQTISGRVAGFCGIKLSDMSSSVNVRMLGATPSFDAEKEILGIYQAKGEILKRKGCHIMTHPLEMVYLSQNEIPQTVTILPHTLAEKQIKQITRFSTNIYLWCSENLGSILETYNRISKLIHSGITVKVIHINKENLVKYLKDQRTSTIEAHANDAKDWLHFLVETFYAKKDQLGLGNPDVFIKILQIINVIPDAIVKGVYVTELSRLINMPEELIWEDLRNL